VLVVFNTRCKACLSAHSSAAATCGLCRVPLHKLFGDCTGAPYDSMQHFTSAAGAAYVLVLFSCLLLPLLPRKSCQPLLQQAQQALWRTA
jgi:hypothetical protein